jgi:hypothetical protein
LLQGSIAGVEQDELLASVDEAGNERMLIAMRVDPVPARQRLDFRRVGLAAVAWAQSFTDEFAVQNACYFETTEPETIDRWLHPALHWS